MMNSTNTFSLRLQEWREKETDRLTNLLDKDTLVRFAYVPYVIARLVWDYADTIVDMAVYLRIREVRPVTRAVRTLKKLYDNERAPFADIKHEDSEEENMLVYEQGVQRITNQMLANITCDLHSEYPNLDEEHVQFLAAVYQCFITLKALQCYCRRQSTKVEEIIKIPVGRFLPDPIYKLADIILLYVGDKPVSHRFAKWINEYIDTFATQMALVRINDVDVASS